MLKLLSVLLLICYPGLIYLGFAHFEPKYLTLVVIAALLLSHLAGPSTFSRTFSGVLLLAPITAYLIASVVTNEEWVVRLYPAVMSLSLAAVFIGSFWSPPPIIERIARLSEPDFPPEGIRYTRALTAVWALFLLANASVAIWTALLASRETWALYNGVISYACVGLLMAIEYPVRRWYRARHAVQ